MPAPDPTRESCAARSSAELRCSAYLPPGTWVKWHSPPCACRLVNSNRFFLAFLSTISPHFSIWLWNCKEINMLINLEWSLEQTFRLCNLKTTGAWRGFNLRLAHFAGVWTREGEEEGGYVVFFLSNRVCWGLLNFSPHTHTQKGIALPFHLRKTNYARWK